MDPNANLNEQRLLAHQLLREEVPCAIAADRLGGTRDRSRCLALPGRIPADGLEATVKIKAEHFAKMKAAVELVAAKHPDSIAAYQRGGFRHKRYRWDLFHAAKIDGVSSTAWICDVIYPYANDEHIDTALRRIVGAEYPQP